MLVTNRSMARTDDGSVLVTVVIVMMVLTVAAITIAGLVVSTASTAASGRTTAQSRAAADAGLADAVATAHRTGDFCSLDLSGSDPAYSVTSSCAAGAVTFTSIGMTGTAETKTQAVYTYSPASSAGSGADFYAYSSLKFTSDVITMAPPARLLSIVVKNGDFECHAKVPANITVNGDFNSKGGCDVAGKVWAGGGATICCVSDHYRGDFITSRTSSVQIRGNVDGQVWAAGPSSSARPARSAR